MHYIAVFSVVSDHIVCCIAIFCVGNAHIVCCVQCWQCPCCALSSMLVMSMLCTEFSVGNVHIVCCVQCW